MSTPRWSCDLLRGLFLLRSLMLRGQFYSFKMHTHVLQVCQSSAMEFQKNIFFLSWHHWQWPCSNFHGFITFPLIPDPPIYNVYGCYFLNRNKSVCNCHYLGRCIDSFQAQYICLCVFIVSRQKMPVRFLFCIDVGVAENRSIFVQIYITVYILFCYINNHF
jgi:hypothetical protein